MNREKKPGTFDHVSMGEKQERDCKIAQHHFEQLDALLGGLRDGRTKSIARTKIEEAAMWVNKAISRDGQ